ncbi:MAG: putative accessory regulator protein, partial [Anaerocolumna sp.]|nr:putative accessory regulator protein [Anaerocolumna sp.]
MITIEILAHKIAEKIALQLDYDDERKAVVAYGLIGIIQMVTIFIIITIIGLIFDTWYESMIIFLGVGMIRKSTGGAHAGTMLSCNIISVVTVTILSALSRYILNIPFNTYVNLGLTVFLFVICFIIFYLRVPVDSPNKPITKPEKIRRLRRQSFLILTLLILTAGISILFTDYNDRFYSIAISIRLILLWQSLTLTKF